jgi:hypothetical protein
MDNMKAGFIHLLLTMKILINWEAILCNAKILPLPSTTIKALIILLKNPGYLYNLS